MSYTKDEVIIPRNIEDEMKESYMRYSMSVIISRALPDVRDGLKPSQRRIFFAMRQLNLCPNGKHRKCAKISGDTSGDYHPHGEHGHLSDTCPDGPKMGDALQLGRWTRKLWIGRRRPAAAMRYTEARLTAASMRVDG